MRLTILQQGEALVKTNSLDLGIIKELRTIRDKVNKVLDMVAVETIKVWQQKILVQIDHIQVILGPSSTFLMKIILNHENISP